MRPVELRTVMSIPRYAGGQALLYSRCSNNSIPQNPNEQVQVAALVRRLGQRVTDDVSHSTRVNRDRFVDKQCAVHSAGAYL